MASNSFGLVYRFTTWGESHGSSIGVVLDGVPPNFELDLERIQHELDRRRPGQSSLTTSRKEADQFKILSGIYEGKTTGAPISFMIENTNQRSKDYKDVLSAYRPGHADFTYHQKYQNYDPLGGGRASARETAGRVIAGAVARQFLEKSGIKIEAELVQVGKVSGSREDLEAEVLRHKQEGDSIGGIVQVRATGVPIGIGEPVYEKLDARLAYAMMSIPAVKGVEIGDGFASVSLKGSEHNDLMDDQGYLSNHCGGILGGISNGEEILVRLALKPTASIFKSQKTRNREGRAVEFTLKGRHDPCVAYRAPVIAEAMMANVLFDLLLLKSALAPI